MTQYGEDEVILAHFEGRTGRFLDIGAHDGVTFSNTQPLAELGWSGVLVEPSPASFCQLIRNVADNPRMELVCAAIVPHCTRFEMRLRRFWANTTDGLSADALSTLDRFHRDKFKDFPFREMWLPDLTVEELFRAFMQPFDFINIDTEGTNVGVLRGVCLAIANGMTQCPSMICCEIESPDAEPVMRKEMSMAGLIQQTVIGGNLIGCR